MIPESATGKFTIRKIAAITFIFACTTLAWVILGTTLLSRTGSSNEQLDGHVASTWGSPQEQSPPSASYKESHITTSTTVEDGKTIVHNKMIESYVFLPLNSSRVQVNLHLDPRQKGLLWYSTYAVDFAGDYSFLNNTTQPQNVTFRPNFPAQKALYDGLTMELNGHTLPVNMDDQGICIQAALAPNETSALHVAYHSQGLTSWRYKLADGVAQSRDFTLNMHANFKDIDFADDTLSPTSKQPTTDGWDLAWRYANLVSGFQIGMTMPEKLQPGPLAGEISYAAPVSLFFFFFLMMIITTLRNIDLHPYELFLSRRGVLRLPPAAGLSGGSCFHSCRHGDCVRGFDRIGRQLSSSRGRNSLRRLRGRWRAAHLPGDFFLRVLLERFYRTGYHHHFRGHAICGDAGHRQDSLVGKIWSNVLHYPSSKHRKRAEVC